MKGYGFALRQESPYREDFSVAILALQDNDYIKELQKRWWPDNQLHCRESNSKKANELTLDNFAGIFAILCIGLSFAATIAIFETALFVDSRKNAYSNMKLKAKIESKDKKGEVRKNLVISEI